MPARKRSRHDDGTITTQSATAVDAKDPNVARLIQVLLMVAQDKTQAQIAAYFDKDVRTIRRWLKRAREMGLAVSSTTTPQDMVDEINNYFLELKAGVLDFMMQAKAENNTNKFLRCVGELRNLELARIAALARIGRFDNFTFLSPHLPNSRAALAQEISAEAQRAVTARTEGPIIEGEVSDG
jgi:hypothetical protein